MTTQKLEVGHDYREIFGLPAGCKMVYGGGDTWTATRPDGQSATMTSAAQTAKAREYVGRAPVLCGSPK
jgi:sugar (pentulose or hexulose) kinase